MKKTIRSLLCLVLVLVAAVSFSAPVHAADWVDNYKVKSLAPGKTAQGQQRVVDYAAYTRSYKIYKITVKSNGYLTFTNQAEKEDHWVRLYASLEDAKALRNTLKWVEGAGTVKSYPVAKGTYYIYPEGNFNFKYTFTKANAGESNFCKAKAKVLKAKAKATICVPDGFQYTRWYKFTLKKSKAITITFTDLTITKDKASANPNFYLYNAAGEKIAVSQKSGSKYQTEKVPKGTYYIKAQTNYDTEVYLYQLSWK